jgi:hypothetical protein
MLNWCRNILFVAEFEGTSPVNVWWVDFDCCYYSNRACNHDSVYWCNIGINTDNWSRFVDTDTNYLCNVLCKHIYGSDAGIDRLFKLLNTYSTSKHQLVVIVYAMIYQ